MSAASTEQDSAESPLKLGQLLYADPTVLLVSEKQWLSLIRAMAAGDKDALRALYEKALPVVFTYLIQLTGDRRLTETLVLDVFELLWCEAPVFDATEGPVLGWIMSRARARALDHTDYRERAPNDVGHDEGIATGPIPVDQGDRRDSMRVPLQRVLEALTLEERRALEGALIHGASYSELAAQCGQSVGTIKNWIRSGLVKMQAALQPAGEPS